MKRTASRANVAWEDVAWETNAPRKEWVVEYYAKVGTESTHHLTVLHGEGMEVVQRMLMQELRATYREAQEIEVTVIRMEEIETEPNVPKRGQQYEQVVF